MLSGGGGEGTLTYTMYNNVKQQDDGAIATWAAISSFKT